MAGWTEMVTLTRQRYTLTKEKLDCLAGMSMLPYTHKIAWNMHVVPDVAAQKLSTKRLTAAVLRYIPPTPEPCSSLSPDLNFAASSGTPKMWIWRTPIFLVTGWVTSMWKGTCLVGRRRILCLWREAPFQGSYAGLFLTKAGHLSQSCQLGRTRKRVGCSGESIRLGMV